MQFFFTIQAHVTVRLDWVLNILYLHQDTQPTVALHHQLVIIQQESRFVAFQYFKQELHAWRNPNRLFTCNARPYPPFSILPPRPSRVISKMIKMYLNDAMVITYSTSVIPIIPSATRFKQTTPITTVVVRHANLPVYPRPYSRWCWAAGAVS